MGNVITKKDGPSTPPPPTSLKGLYPRCDWDQKTVKRLIMEKRLAPIFVGAEEQVDDQLEECPICFLYYPGGLNRSKCCHKGMCTECFLQVKRPSSSAGVTCPFCNHGSFVVEFTGPLSREEQAKEEQEQLKVLELKVQMRKDELERDRLRELEKERRRQEQSAGRLETSASTSSTSTSTSIPTSPPTPPHPSHSPENHHTNPPPPWEHHSSSLQEPSILPSQEADVDDLLLKEAIRLSLLRVDSDAPSIEGSSHVTHPTTSPPKSGPPLSPSRDPSSSSPRHDEHANDNASPTNVSLASSAFSRSQEDMMEELANEESKRKSKSARSEHEGASTIGVAEESPVVDIL
eukprot:TRINITY_DN3839_c0_g1_i5.p1 TRINITY_DN3839_c0_g1~~TRINITY_DN3839_c0_g1_i5.p1  ORF type:complete len:348 (+),score=75.93 TRINITY_DN3839_c0_g1_i5:61-1104(+)